jgi:hypothetical protein
MLSRWLLITLPPWIPPAEDKVAEGLETTGAWDQIVL